MASSASRTFCFLTAKQIGLLHARLIIPGVAPSQEALLDSAANSPMNTKHYTNTTDIFQLAAVLSEKIIKNHTFQDGNKRTALVAADMFLKISGYSLQEDPMAQYSVNTGLTNAHNAVCTNQWSPEQLARYYKAIATPLTEWKELILQYRKEAIEY